MGSIKNENLNSGIFNENTKIKWGSESQKVLCELGSVILGVQQETEKQAVNTYEVESPGYSSDYDDVFEGSFEGSDDFRDDDTTEDSIKEEKTKEYSVTSDFPEYYGEEEKGEKRDDYLF